MIFVSDPENSAKFSSMERRLIHKNNLKELMH